MHWNWVKEGLKLLSLCLIMWKKTTSHKFCFGDLEVRDDRCITYYFQMKFTLTFQLRTPSRYQRAKFGARWWLSPIYADPARWWSYMGVGRLLWSSDAWFWSRGALRTSNGAAGGRQPRSTLRSRRALGAPGRCRRWSRRRGWGRGQKSVGRWSSARSGHRPVHQDGAWSSPRGRWNYHLGEVESRPGWKSNQRYFILKLRFPKKQCAIGLGGWKAILETQQNSFWAKFDNPFKRTNYAKFLVSPSLDGTLPESVVP